MRRVKHGNQAEQQHGLSTETAINIGHRHSANEQWAKSVAEAAGNPYLVADIARRLSALLEDTAVRAELGDTSLVPGVPANGQPAARAGRAEHQHFARAEGALHAHPSRNGAPGRTLSPEARERIAAAQRIRWRLAKAKARAGKGQGWSRKEIKLKDVLALRKQGLTLPEIGQKLGCSIAKLSRVLHDGQAGDGRSTNGGMGRWTPERREAWSKARKAQLANPKKRKAMLKRMESMRAAKLRAELLRKAELGTKNEAQG
jgi:hypothetical protein